MKHTPPEPAQLVGVAWSPQDNEARIGSDEDHLYCNVTCIWRSRNVGSYSPSSYNISKSAPSVTVCLEESLFRSGARLEAWTRRNANQIPMRRVLTSDTELRRESQRSRPNRHRPERLGLRFDKNRLNARGSSWGRICSLFPLSTGVQGEKAN